MLSKERLSNWYYPLHPFSKMPGMLYCLRPVFDFTELPLLLQNVFHRAVVRMHWKLYFSPLWEHRKELSTFLQNFFFFNNLITIVMWGVNKRETGCRVYRNPVIPLLLFCNSRDNSELKIYDLVITEFTNKFIWKSQYFGFLL